MSDVKLLSSRLPGPRQELSRLDQIKGMVGRVAYLVENDQSPNDRMRLKPLGSHGDKPLPLRHILRDVNLIVGSEAAKGTCIVRVGVAGRDGRRVHGQASDIDCPSVVLRVPETDGCCRIGRAARQPRELLKYGYVWMARMRYQRG